MSEDLKDRVSKLVELLKKNKNRVLKHPSNVELIKRMIGQWVGISASEAQYEIDSTTSEHYDDYIIQALHDISLKKVSVGEDGKTVEHPHDRIRRLGEESIKAGKTSQIYLLIKDFELKNKGLPDFKQPRRRMIIAQRRLDLALSFKAHLNDYLVNPPLKVQKTRSKSEIPHSAVRKKVPTLKDAKRAFEKKYSKSFTPRAINLALAEYGLNIHSYHADSARKGKGKKNEN
ncbi:hypothetical protein ACO0K2_01700 [Undibacterium sp. MH2W]|uniref:hypothetical protein n=1 Tax=Undibacterium sp. MH2W TaxID=3413044 RepID=UPI003BF40E9E